MIKKSEIKLHAIYMEWKEKYLNKNIFGYLQMVSGRLTKHMEETYQPVT